MQELQYATFFEFLALIRNHPILAICNPVKRSGAINNILLYLESTISRRSTCSDLSSIDTNQQFYFICDHTAKLFPELHLVNHDSRPKKRLLSYAYSFIIMLTLLDNHIASSSSTVINHYIKYLRSVRMKNTFVR